MNVIQNFNLKGNEVRMITDDKGEPWFSAKDTCRALGLSNVTEATRNINPDRKVQFKLSLRGRAPIFVNESGAYDLILQSRKPQAVEFKKWVVGTVLPAIRKTGGYIMDEENCETDDELALRAMKMLQSKVDQYKEEREALTKKAL